MCDLMLGGKFMSYCVGLPPFVFNSVCLDCPASDPSLNFQEERVEQLRSFSFLSGVLAGFAVAAPLAAGGGRATDKAGLPAIFCCHSRSLCESQELMRSSS